MKKLLFLISTVLFYSCAAQNLLPVAGKSNVSLFKADAFIGRDQFGSLYYITDNILTKQTGANTTDYNNPAKGKISHIDIQNPLLLLIFYESFNSVVLLDYQLNEVTQITFSNPDFPVQAQAAGLAGQNKIWIYDSLQQQILLYDFKQNGYRRLTTSFKENIKYYESDFNNFHWIDEQLNRFSCDVYGKISTYGKVPDFENCRMVSNTAVIYLLKGQLYFFNAVDGKSTPMEIAEKTFISFWYKDQILSIFTKDGITNYIIKIP